MCKNTMIHGHGIIMKYICYRSHKRHANRADPKQRIAFKRLNLNPRDFCRVADFPKIIPLCLPPLQFAPFFRCAWHCFQSPNRRQIKARYAVPLRSADEGRVPVQSFFHWWHFWRGCPFEPEMAMELGVRLFSNLSVCMGTWSCIS